MSNKCKSYVSEDFGSWEIVVTTVEANLICYISVGCTGETCDELSNHLYFGPDITRAIQAVEDIMGQHKAKDRIVTEVSYFLNTLTN